MRSRRRSRMRSRRRRRSRARDGSERERVRERGGQKSFFKELLQRTPKTAWNNPLNLEIAIWLARNTYHFVSKVCDFNCSDFCHFRLGFCSPLRTIDFPFIFWLAILYFYKASPTQHPAALKSMTVFLRFAFRFKIVLAILMFLRKCNYKKTFWVFKTSFFEKRFFEKKTSFLKN